MEKRKEVWLSQDVIDRLQKMADKKGWSLKKFMESTLVSKSMPAKKNKTLKHEFNG